MKRILVFLAICIHLFFYISAIKTHTLDYFFPWGNVHDAQGIDFYQVPNGGHAYLNGGELTGQMPAGDPPYFYGNTNVYHPFFTLVVGGMLQIFSPRTAFYVWWTIHALITAIVASILYRRYSTHKNFVLAFFLYLAAFPHYLEIWNGQYHFLLDAALFFILLASLKQKDSVKSGIYYALALLVKPIGLLWLIPFMIKKQWKTIIAGLGIFFTVTLPFLMNGKGLYYVVNLLERFNNPIGGPPGVFTLDALFRHWEISLIVLSAVKIITIGGILVVIWRLRLNLFQSLFLCIAYYLLFYDLVFEYHYTTLATVLPLAILTQKAFQGTLVKILSISYVLPTPFFLFHFYQIGAEGHTVTDQGWVILVLFRIVPLILIVFLTTMKFKHTNSK